MRNCGDTACPGKGGAGGKLVLVAKAQTEELGEVQEADIMDRQHLARNVRCADVRWVPDDAVADALETQK